MTRQYRFQTTNKGSIYIGDYFCHDSVSQAWAIYVCVPDDGICKDFEEPESAVDILEWIIDVGVEWKDMRSFLRTWDVLAAMIDDCPFGEDSVYDYMTDKEVEQQGLNLILFAPIIPNPRIKGVDYATKRIQI